MYECVCAYAMQRTKSITALLPWTVPDLTRGMTRINVYILILHATVDHNMMEVLNVLLAQSPHYTKLSTCLDYH